MKRHLLFQLAASALPLTAFTQEHPNIILFMVDDMGWQDTSLPFAPTRSMYNDRYRTPNMERLARKGMMMTAAYASPISSPSRCSLMTGTNAARHGVTNWTLNRNQMTDASDSVLMPANWNTNGICPVEGVENTFHATSFVELLRQAGYHTIHVGKAHLGAIGTPGEDPCNFGFDVNIAGHAGGGPATYLSERRFGYDEEGKSTSVFAIPGLEQYWNSGTFLTEALTREAIAQLEKTKDRPFYLYMSHYAIHVPIDRDPRYFTKYLADGLSEKEAAYASLIEGMDHSLGQIMDWVEKNADNTIIIFMSDNGGYCTGTYWRDEPLYTQNFPLRCGKGSLYEGGIREPMIVSWPGRTKPGSKCHDYLIIEDFFPSILEMAGVMDYNVPQTIDGVSFVPLIDGLDADHERELVWNFPNIWDNEGPGISLNAAIRKGRWKLIYSYKTATAELYDIEADISEDHDLATAHPDITHRLLIRLSTYLRGTGAGRPIVKSTGLPCPWPDGKQ